MSGYPLLDIFLSTLYFFGWVLWIILMFWIIMDIFRSPDLSGWAKAGWLVAVIVLPLLGVLIYLIARGGAMQERRDRRAIGAYSYGDYSYGEAAGTAEPAAGSSQSDELAKLATLHQRGVLNDEEFQRAKTRVV
jgi:hypothetical protein